MTAKKCCCVFCRRLPAAILLPPKTPYRLNTQKKYPSDKKIKVFFPLFIKFANTFSFPKRDKLLIQFLVQPFSFRTDDL